MIEILIYDPFHCLHLLADDAEESFFVCQDQIRLVRVDNNCVANMCPSATSCHIWLTGRDTWFIFM